MGQSRQGARSLSEGVPRARGHHNHHFTAHAAINPEGGGDTCSPPEKARSGQAGQRSKLGAWRGTPSGRDRRPPPTTPRATAYLGRRRHRALGLAAGRRARITAEPRPPRARADLGHVLYTGGTASRPAPPSSSLVGPHGGARRGGARQRGISQPTWPADTICPGPAQQLSPASLFSVA